MTKKELHAALDLHIRIQRLKSRLTDLGYVNCKAPEVRVQGGCAVSAGQIAAELSEKIIDFEKSLEIEMEIIRRHLIRCQLNEIERKLMVLRYVRCYSWAQVCNNVYITDLRGARFFENASLQDAVFSLGGALESCGRRSFNLRGKGGQEILSLNSDNISNLSAPVDLSEFAKDHPYSLRERNIFLEVRASVMVGNAKWTFGYRNHGVQAKIEDEDWLRKVKAELVDIRGRMGLYADIRVEGMKDKEGVPINDTEAYYIEKIHSVKYDIGTNGRTKLE